MSGAFNLQTGLVANNGQIPAIGTAVGGGGGGVANVNGIVSRQGDGSTDLAVNIGAGLSYVPPGTAGGTLSATAVVGANVNGVVSRQGDGSTDTAVQFNNGIKYTPPATAGGLIDILSAPTADMKNTPTAGGEQFLSDPDGIQLRATNTPASVGGDAVFTYKNATTNYAWEAPTGSGTNMPIGCMIMYYTNTGFTTDPAGAGNGYFLNFGVECWKLCDGTTGSIPSTGSAFGATPDLINKFARGINTSAPPQFLPENININVGAITLTNNELPTHDHQQVSVVVSGATTTGPTSCDHEHNNCPGTWGFNYWVPNGTPGTGGGGGLSATICNNDAASACPAYNGAGGSAGGNRTGGVSSSITSLATHTHNITFSTPVSTTGTAGLGNPFTPTAGGTSIKPTSYDVLYIVRVF